MVRSFERESFARPPATTRDGTVPVATLTHQHQYPTCNARDQFMFAKFTKKKKNVTGGINFTNLKTIGDYIAKLKPQ